LQYFAEILNKIDDILELFMREYKNSEILDAIGGNGEVCANPTTDKSIIESCLKFTSMILSNSIEKGIYESMEVGDI